MKFFSLTVGVVLIALLATASSANFCRSCQMFLWTLKNAMPIEKATIEKYTELLQIACNKYPVEADMLDCMKTERPHLTYALNGFKAGKKPIDICFEYGDCKHDDDDI